MRRRFNWLVLAVCSLVVVAFVVPLALLVQRQARERAQVDAEQRAQSVASVLAVSVAAGDGNEADLAEAALVADATIVLPDGTVVGTGDAPTGLVDTVRRGASATSEGVDGAWRVGIPVATSDGVAAVIATAPPEEMSQGVAQASLLLGGLAVVLVAASVLLADRLGISLVRPVDGLAQVAGRLAQGDLSARADPDRGPEETRAVATAMNELASRLDEIIAGEREALADLSHRLRTPLTSLRLQAEGIADPDHRGRLLAQVDRTQRAVDQLIADVRTRGTEARDTATDLAAVVGERAAFWRVLAEEQGREMRVTVPDHPVPVPASERDLAAVLDVLIGNVFAHTPAGTSFAVEARLDETTPVLHVGDEGPGFGGRHRFLERGESGSGSTGLGLDIARTLGTRLGGGLDVDEGPAGGALVSVRLGP